MEDEANDDVNENIMQDGDCDEDPRVGSAQSWVRTLRLNCRPQDPRRTGLSATGRRRSGASEVSEVATATRILWFEVLKAGI